ncbi:hypothetical protein GCM10009665_10320 [Kitasatospora nipponensis]|uniref:Ig-like domain-containing protein n=1 Tax=Kitasatospora nipponensis TaxID=258049 RepID=A0ABP4GJ36_9ACTN
MHTDTARPGRLALLGAGAALVLGAVLAAAPAAQAAPAQHAVAASMFCYSEPIGGPQSLGHVDCTLQTSGVGAVSVSWSVSNYYAVLYSGPTELDVSCGHSLTGVLVTATVTDSTGARTSTSRSTSCQAGETR